MTTKVPNDEKMLAKLGSGFASLDEQRANGLLRMKDFQATQTTMLEKEQTRLEKKYSADHPILKEITERLIYNQGLRPELDREIDKSKIVIPEIDANTWMVHGQIKKADGIAISNLSVSLCDEKEQSMSQLGHGCTDELGYFALQYKATENARPPLANNQKLFLTVTDTNRNRLYQAAEPLYVRLGYIDYRLIVIKDPAQICTPPETEGIAH